MNNRQKINPEAWTFEWDIKKIQINKIIKRRNKIFNRNIIFVLFIVMLLYYFFSHFFESTVKAEIVSLIVEIFLILLEYLTISFLEKKVLKKYWPMIAVPLMALTIIIIFVFIYGKGNFILNQSDILAFSGSMLTFTGTFCLGYFIYIQDRTKTIEEKRTKIRLLIYLLENANEELLRLICLERKKKYIKPEKYKKYIKPIYYDKNWIVYYLEFVSLCGENSELKHTLEVFFNKQTEINMELMDRQLNAAVKHYNDYIEYENYSMKKYNLSEAINCLKDACNDYQIIKTKSWIEHSETIDLINKLCKKYYFIIENYIYVWLLRHNVETTTDSDNLNRELVDWLLENSTEIKDLIKYPSDKRIISRVVYDCSLKFKEYSKKVNLAGGEYFLR